MSKSPRVAQKHKLLLVYAAREYLLFFAINPSSIANNLSAFSAGIGCRRHGAGVRLLMAADTIVYTAATIAET